MRMRCTSFPESWEEKREGDPALYAGMKRVVEIIE
jgi:hypothetical protein